jgi:GrpB-like predicted nucleotidyltransferase (UPF0157 family)
MGELIKGLKKQTVTLEKHSPDWKPAFELESRNIVEVLRAGGLSATIEHVGSTAVRGLSAKPILDIAVGFKSANEAVRARALLREHEYDYVPAANRPGMIFLARGDERRFAHLHLVVRGSHAWNNLVVVRDYLRRHRTAAEAYGEAKAAAAKKFPKNRLAYAEAKNPSIEAIAIKALIAYDRRRIAAAMARERSPARNLDALSPLHALSHAAITQHWATVGKQRKAGGGVAKPRPDAVRGKV